ncbi:hypothetical protein ZWY2020_021321 [Hordeum vulgare]|nr:hypothetical protein ZWY2020_021321 [Hordeum vulgare]
MAANFALRSALRGGRSARDHALGLRSCLGAKVSDLVSDSSSAVSPFGRATGSGCNGCNLMQYVEKGLCTTGSRLSRGLFVKSYFCSNPSTSLSSSGARFFCTKKEVPDEHIKKVDAFLKQYQRDRVFMSTGLELIVKEVLLLKEEVAQSDYVQKRLTKIGKDTFLLSAGQIESIGHAWTVGTYFFGAIALVSLLFSIVKTVQENDVPYTDYIHLLNAIRSQALDRGISKYKAEKVEREAAKKLKSDDAGAAAAAALSADVPPKSDDAAAAAALSADVPPKSDDAAAAAALSADVPPKSDDAVAAAALSADVPPKSDDDGGAAAAAALSADVPPKSDDDGGAAAAAAALSADVPPKSDDDGGAAAAAAALSADVPPKSDAPPE